MVFLNWITFYKELVEILSFSNYGALRFEKCQTAKTCRSSTTLTAIIKLLILFMNVFYLEFLLKKWKRMIQINGLEKLF